MHWIAPFEKDTANGAKMPRANWDVLEKFQVVIPKGKVAGKFSTLFAKIIAHQQALIFQIGKTSARRATCCCRVCCRGRWN